MEQIFILLMTTVTAKDVSSLASRDESFVQHAIFDNLENCERALVIYASQAEPKLKFQKNQLGHLEAYTFANRASETKVSRLRILLPMKNALPLSLNHKNTNTAGVRRAMECT
tara:strand:+ start:157 stop:495 length:339 start_codon:yes stop_codon:yes gene_type:complete